MISRVAARVAIFGVVGVVGLIGGLGLGRPELIAIAAAPMLLLAVGIARDHPPRPVFDVSLEREELSKATG